MNLRGRRGGARLFGGLLFLAARAVLPAQERSLEELPGLRERAVVLDIVARVVEREEIWDSASSKVTIPGRPVGLKLLGDNLVVAVQFTPYLRRNGPSFLVAQGQIWVEVPGQGIHYQTTLQTIPLDFGERIYFFPLGPRRGPAPGEAGTRGESAPEGGAEPAPYIEIQIELRPYYAGGAPESPEGETGEAPAPNAPAPANP